MEEVKNDLVEETSSEDTTKEGKQFTIQLCSRLFLERDVKIDLSDLYQNLEKVDEEVIALIREIVTDKDAGGLFFGEEEVDLDKLIDKTLLSKSVVTLVGMLLDLEGKYNFSEFFITKKLADRYLLRVIEKSVSTMLWENMYDNYIDFSECGNIKILSQTLDDITNDVDKSDFSNELRKILGIDFMIQRERYSFYKPLVNMFSNKGDIFTSKRMVDFYSTYYNIEDHMTILKVEEYDDFFVDATSDFFYCHGDVNMITDIGKLHFSIDNSLALINCLLTIYDMKYTGALIKMDLDDESSLGMISAVLTRIYHSESLMWAWGNSQIVLIDSSGFLDYLPKWYDLKVKDTTLLQ